MLVQLSVLLRRNMRIASEQLRLPAIADCHAGRVRMLGRKSARVWEKKKIFFNWRKQFCCLSPGEEIDSFGVQVTIGLTSLYCHCLEQESLNFATAQIIVVKSSSHFIFTKCLPHFGGKDLLKIKLLDLGSFWSLILSFFQVPEWLYCSWQWYRLVAIQAILSVEEEVNRSMVC